MGFLFGSVVGGGAEPGAPFDATITVDTAGRLTMGMAAAEGQVPSGSALQIGSHATQCDVKNQWADGSLKFAVLSANVTTGSKAITVVSDPGGSHTPTWPTASVVFTRRANTDWPWAKAAAVGTGGATTYWYRFASVDGSAHESFATPTLRFASGNATLSGTNYNRLQGAVPASAASVKIFRGSSYGGETLMATQSVTKPTVSSITSSGTTCTVTTSSAHGLSVGDYFEVTGCTQGAYNGQQVVQSVPTSTTLTYTTQAGTPAASPATGSPAIAYFEYHDTGADTPGVATPKADTTDDPGTAYTAALGSFDGSDTWLNGAVVREARTRVRPVDGSSNPLGLIRVVFDVRSYAAGEHRFDVAIENTEDAASMDRIGPYDISLVVDGDTLWTLNEVTSYSFTRWHKRAWTGSGADAEITPDFEPFYQAKIFPRIDPDITARTFDTTSENYTRIWGGGPIADRSDWQIGCNATTLAAGGGRAELNFLHEADACYLVHKTQALRAAVIGNGDLSGCWSFFPTKADGSVPKLGTDYATDWWMDGRSGVGSRPLLPFSPDGFSFRGTRASYGDTSSDTCAWGAPANMDAVGMEHIPSLNFTPYMMTGDRWFMDQCKHWGTMAIVNTTAGWSQPDPTVFPGLYRGRDGATGNERIMQASGMGREFAWPLRALAMAAHACPDDDADRSYFMDSVQNNLQYISDYHDYMLTNGSTVWGGALPAESATTGDWGARRTMTVSGVSSGATSTITCDSAHHFSTGDYITLSNGTQYQITVTGSTTFTVAANVSGITSATKTTGRKQGLWRVGYTVYVTDWILRQGVCTDPGSVYDWIEKFCAFGIMINVDDSTFVSDPRPFWWYPLLATMDGKYVTAWHDTLTLMDRNKVGSGVYYSSGSDDGYAEYQDAAIFGGHIAEREFFYRLGLRRGLANAQSAIDRIRSVTDYLAHRTTANSNRGYAVEFGDEVD